MSPRREAVALTVGALMGALLTRQLVHGPSPAHRSDVGASIPALSRSIRRSPSRHGSGRAINPWQQLRPNACDGPPLGIKVPVPPKASIGRFAGEAVPLLRTLVRREDIALLARDLNLTGSAAELGVWRGEFAEANMRVWPGKQYVLIDMWADSDCVNGNASTCVYATKEGRDYDKMVTKLRMERFGPRWSGRYLMLQNSTHQAVKLFPDGYFDWIYIDATHTYAEAKADLEAWYAKVRVGGLISGHDYQFQHQSIGDGYVFGVRDAVDEFAAKRHLRVYTTMEQYLPSFYFLKCTLE